MRFQVKPINIDGIDYKVTVEQVDNMADNQGSITYRDSHIRVLDTLKDNQHNSVLLHESLHGISMHRDLDLTEHQIRSMTFGLIGLVRNNKGLFNSIISGEKYGKR